MALSLEANDDGEDDAARGSNDAARVGGSVPERAPTGGRGPVIVYASRTHSQLTQVIRELKSTRYRPRMAVVGSREQMCVHKETRALRGAALHAACAAAVENRSCAHHVEVDRFVRSDPAFGQTEPVDVEDLVRLGEGGAIGSGSRGPCPYYLARDMAERADVVFMPYNYLVDAKTREQFFGREGGRLRDAVVLIDEAHNIESVCAESASFDVPAAHLAAAAREAQEAFEIRAAEEEGLAGDGGDASGDASGLRFNARGRAEDDGFGGGGERLGVNGNKRGGNASGEGPSRPAIEYKQLRGVVLALEAKIAACLAEGSKTHPGGSREVVRDPEFFFSMLASLRITEGADGGAEAGGGDPSRGGAADPSNTLALLLAAMRDATRTLARDAAGAGSKAASRASAYKLEAIADALEKAFRVRRDGHSDSYRVRIAEDPRRDADVSIAGGGERGSAFGGAGHSAGPTLSFWCFAPGVVMSALKRLGVRSVVLTSGTLSPMGSFAHELRLPFPVRLENPHVVANDRVFGAVVPVGPSGKRLNSSYKFRDTDAYKTELGNVIVNVARIVPDGLLVFFPSYGVMRACVEWWRACGTPSIWERIESAKTCVVEPKTRDEFQREFERFNAALDRGEGAAFFAVCRGKVSEGIDFADKAGRAVVLTGIPYAPKADAKVRLKRTFLDEKIASANARRGGADVSAENDVARRAAPVGPSDASSSGDLTGEAWYSQSAMRAVNQALGRVIRHKDDHGAVILCDERFGYGNVRAQLSTWLRPAVQPFDSFGRAAAKLSQFFKHCAVAAPPPRPRKAAAAFEGPKGPGRRPAAIPAAMAMPGARPAIPAPFLVADPGAAPPAYPRRSPRKPKGGLAAMLASKREENERGGGATNATKTTNATRLAKTTPLASAGPGGGGGGGGGTRADTDADPAREPLDPEDAREGETEAGDVRRPSPAPARVGLVASGGSPSRASGPARVAGEEKIKLFMRRAKSELDKRRYDELTRTLRAFRAGEKDVPGVLRAATRLLRADDDPFGGLYALFGAFVPAEHRHIHEKHVEALRARAAAAAADGSRRDGVINKRPRDDGAPPRDGGGLRRGAGPMRDDGAPLLGANALSRRGGGFSASGANGAGSSSRGEAPGERAAVAVARPPPRCVRCGNAARKPFEARCGHPGCYSCWLELLGEAKREGAGGEGAACPSCHQPVLKRQLTKVFFT